ncbi:MAG: hypothetical protein IJJ82_05635 [Clostridia bacterium]|nr:hypothetical protein [Clostridia bacterium]
MIFESKIKKIDIEDLNIYDLLYYNELIKNVFHSIKESEEKRVKTSKHFIYYEIDNLQKYDLFLNEKMNLLEKCSLIIYFNCNSFKELLIKVKLDNDKNDNITSFIVNKAFLFLKDLKEKMKSNQYVENYFLESFQLRHGRFADYYNFDFIELDFGKFQKIYAKPVIVKTKIKYKKILNEEVEDMNCLVDTLKIDRDIILKLVQLFFRTTFERVTDGMYYDKYNEDFIYNLNTEENGKFLKCNRNKLIEYQDEYANDDIDKCFIIFYKLKYDDKCVYLQACEAYIEGLKTSDGKEIMFFVIALETLANYEFDNKEEAKSEKIYNLISNLYDENVVTKEYIDYIYDIRSLYSHQGISNNRIKQKIFNIFENNEHLMSEVEKLSYSVLIRWLLSKGELNGR